MPARASIPRASTPAALPRRRRLTREESRAETQTRLLAAARETFARRGFEGCSVDDLAEAAGYSKGAFYSNFPSKEAVFLELLRQHKAQGVAALANLAQEEGDAEQLIARLAAFSQQAEGNHDWCLLSIEFQLRAAREPAFRREFNALCREERAAMSRFLKTLYTRAKVAPPAKVSLEQMAGAVLAQYYGLTLQQAADPASLPSGAMSEITRLFQRALLGVPGKLRLNRSVFRQPPESV